MSLALLTFLKIPGTKGKLLDIGFLFSDLGDILLELERYAYFVFGLAAFLIAHIFYITVFIRKPVFVKPRSIIVLIIIGACLFILSDSIIAVNKFLMPVPFSSFWIMTIYYSAQFFIISGSLKPEQVSQKIS